MSGRAIDGLYLNTGCQSYVNSSSVADNQGPPTPCVSRVPAAFSLPLTSHAVFFFGLMRPPTLLHGADRGAVARSTTPSARCSRPRARTTQARTTTSSLGRPAVAATATAASSRSTGAEITMVFASSVRCTLPPLCAHALGFWRHTEHDDARPVCPPAQSRCARNVSRWTARGPIFSSAPRASHRSTSAHPS
jgi:hypothetical protein